MGRRKVAAGALVASAGLCAAACGGGAGGGTVASSLTVGPLAKAAAVTEQAHTAEFSMTMTFGGTPSASNPVLGKSISAHGALDFTTHRGSFDYDMPGVGQFHAVVDGATVYANIPQLASVLGGRQWLSVDLDTIGKAVGVSGMSGLEQTSSSNPADYLSYLRGAGDVQTLGQEIVGGATTTHYHAVVDLNRAAQSLPAPQQATIRQVIGLAGTPTFPADVWVDGAGLVRQVRFAFDYSHSPQPKVAAVGGMQVTVDYSNFGAPVSVIVPPASQVESLSDLMAQAPGQSHPPVSPSAGAAALASKLIAAVPAGYVQQPDSVGDTGPSDLAKAARDDGQPDATQTLTSDGFVAGYQRLWRKGNTQIIDFLYQFSSDSGAGAYLQRSLAGLARGDNGVTPSRFTVSGVPGANGFSESVPPASGGGSAFVVVFAKGPYLAQVVLSGPDASVAAATPLAAGQYGRL